MEPFGDPDTNHNGIGIEISIYPSYRPPYEVGQVMDALVASGSRDTYAITGPSAIIGRSYYDLVVDMVDAYAWGQNDTAAGGGWRYSWNSHPDNSAAQWGAIGMLAAEEIWNIDIPQWVKDRNNIWLSYSYNGTGFGYSGAGNGNNTTPSGMVQVAFCNKRGIDDPATPEDDRDPRWATAEDYIANQWNASWWFPNSGSNSFSYYGYYAFAKSMRLAYPEPVVNLHATGLDWFKDEDNGMARRLINRQQSDGGWPRDSNPGWYVGYDLTTAWSVIILTPTLFVQPPVADAGEDRVWGVDVPLTLDGSGSFHLDPFRSIVTYEWDLDGDGVFDTESTDPTFSHTYSSVDYPEGTLPQNIKVTLKVTDNNDPAIFDTDTATITIAVPPHPPVADAGGTYTCTAGIPCELDGSASFDIDPTDFITAWQWDLNGDFIYDDASGMTPMLTFTTVGAQNIGLRVTDNGVMNDINGNGVQDPEERMEDFAFTKVTIQINNPPLADADGPYVVDEGSVVTLSGAGSSDPDNDPISFNWDLDNDGFFDDSTGPAPDFAGIDDGIFQVSLEVDDTLLTTSDSSSVTVNNVAPTVEAGSAQVIVEGSSVSLTTAGFTDPGILDSHSATIDWGDLSPVASGVVNETNGNGSVAGSHTYVEDGSYVVTLTVTDDDGGVGFDTLLVTVTNAPPLVEAGPDQSTDVGLIIDLPPATFTDLGITDTHTALINWGDGLVESATVSESNGSGTAAGSHAYGAGGDYTVTVTVTDDENDSGSDSFIVHIFSQANNPPLVDAGSDATIDEGSSFIGSGSFSDPDTGDSWTATVDYGDGSGLQPLVLNPDKSFSLSHPYRDEGVFTVMVEVTDSTGNPGSDALTVTVVNVAPQVIAEKNQTINEGMNAIFTGSFTDPGPDDTHTVVWNFGDGSTPETYSLAGPCGTDFDCDGDVDGIDLAALQDHLGLTLGDPDYSPVYDLNHDDSIDNQDMTLFSSAFGNAFAGALHSSHVYADNGTYSVTLTVTDNDGGVGSDSVTVTVNNVVPVVDAGPDATIQAGDLFSSAGSFTDPGADSWMATVDYGNGSGSQTLSLNADKTFILNHVYAGMGVYTVTITVIDDDGGSGSDTAVVTVSALQIPPVTDLYVRTKPGESSLVWTHVGGVVYNIYRSTNGGDYELIGTRLIPGDLNGDGDVNATDLLLFDTAFGSQVGDSHYNQLADINQDGVVDDADLWLITNPYINSTGETILIYVDTALTNGTEYCYRVRTVNAAGQEFNDSNEACAIPMDR